MELACFVYLELVVDDNDKNGEECTTTTNNNNSDDELWFHITAIEYSRQHREQLLRQEFGSWLLEEHIESSVIATDPVGKVVFWNRFATELYQYLSQEAIGNNIMELTPSEMTQEQGIEIFGRLVKGEHWKGFFGVKRKDGTQFIAHVTDTPVLNQDGELKFVVGVSADYTLMHDLMAELKTLNTNLESEVESRTKQLLEREQKLRMVGAAIKESDTAIIITEDDGSIIWANGAVCKLLHLSEEELVHQYPWNLPMTFDFDDIDVDPVERQCPEEHSPIPNAQTYFQSQSTKKMAPIKAIVTSDPTTNQNNMVTNAKEDDTDSASSTTPTSSSPETYLSVSVQSMADSKQRMIILRDTTTEYKMTQEQRKAEMAEAASASKTEMMQMLSHDFRTPLQGIMGVVSTMLVDLDKDSMAYEDLSCILASSRLLLTLIGNVLDLGKLDADKMDRIELNSIPVLPSIIDTMTFCEHFGKIHNVKLTLENSEAGQTVKASRLRLEQMYVYQGCVCICVVYF